jgi:hypothetical protein
MMMRLARGILLGTGFVAFFFFLFVVAKAPVMGVVVLTGAFLYKTKVAWFVAVILSTIFGRK